MNKILFILALLISFSSLGQENLLKKDNISENAYEYDKNGKCNFFDTFYTVQDEIYYGDYDKYIAPSSYNEGRWKVTSGRPGYFNSDDFEILKKNIDTVSNKSVLKKENNTFQFEFYNSDNLNIYENPENLKRFIAQLDNKYIEKNDKYLKVINTKGRKKSHYEYKVNYDKGDYELNYFNVGHKEILRTDDQIYRKYDKYQLVESIECDGNKLITKSFDKNGQISNLYEAYVETLSEIKLMKKTILTKYYPSGNISALTTTDEIWASIDPKRGIQQTISFDANDNQLKDKFLERKSIFEAYSEDGVFSIKNDSAHNINNGDIINVFKKHKNGKKEI